MDKLMGDDTNGTSFMLEENRKRDMGRLLGWTDEEIKNYYRNKDRLPFCGVAQDELNDGDKIRDANIR